MAKQIINVGARNNDGTGDSLRVGATKVNDNFSEIYNLLGDGENLSVVSRITAGQGLAVSNSTGAVLITGRIASANDVGLIKVGENLTISQDGTLSAQPTEYSLPTASSTVLGGVKVGTGLAINQGVLSNTVSAYTLPTASTSLLGGVRVDGTSITVTNGIISSTPYVLPTATDSILGGIKIGAGLSISQGVVSVTGTSNSSDRLVNGSNEAVLGTNGNITLPPYGNLPEDTQTGIIFGDGSLQTTAYNLDEYSNLNVGNFVAAGGFTNYGGSVYIRASRPDADATLDFEFKENGQFKLPAGGDIVDINGTSVLGGGSTTQPYLELTQEAFITQPVTLGTPVTVTAEMRGVDSLVSVTIGSGEGPFIDSITIDTPGNGYVVGQRYRINYWQIGGNDDADNIIFEVGTVGPAGTLLTVVNQVFEGTFTASNTPATYTGVSIEYIATEFDEVDTGLTLTREFSGFFNSEVEFSHNTSVSPIGTLWNADGWDTLVGFRTRTYDTFDSILFGPDNAPPPELIMWDTINDKYYKFGMNVWGIDNNEYSYTRTLIDDPNYFRKTDGLQDGEIDNIKPQTGETLQLEIDYLEAEQLWVDVRDQDAADIAPDTRPWDGMPSYQAYDILIATFPIEPAPLTGDLVPRANNAKNAYLAWQEARAEAIGITRGLEQGIYNPYRENGWNSNTSPAGTLWNIDGWNDLTDIESRTYTNFYAAYGNGQLGNKVPGSKAIMYVSETDKYYAIDWISWTQGGDYGGFSYTRREIDLTKLDQGVRFADGTVQTTAYIPTNVVSTAPGERRIETASGYNQVSVTQRVTNTYTGAINATTNGYELRVARTTELDAVLVPINNGNTSATFTLSFDNVTFREVWLSSIQSTEYWFYYQVDNNQTTPQTEDDPVYLRVTTGGDSVAWWSKNTLPGGSDNFRGAVIDYHAYTGDGTIIGTIHIVDDDGEEYITHTEVSSGSTDSMNNDLWIVTSEGTIRYGRFDGEASTLKIQWTARVFYGDELYD